MQLSRRSVQLMALALTALPFAAALARAEDYPTRPVRLIVGFPAGSGPDIVARIIAQGMSDRLGQSVVVENRPGAGSNLATSDVAHAVPDGYMLMLLTTANVINATLYQNLNYDLMRDIVPVASIDNEPFVFEVNPSFPAKTLQEFIAYAKANPGKVTMASAGIGSVARSLQLYFSNIRPPPRNFTRQSLVTYFQYPFSDGRDSVRRRMRLGSPPSRTRGV
jgi:tripartite-type tricarboxylate transporter receptor subunit TctC